MTDLSVHTTRELDAAAQAIRGDGATLLRGALPAALVARVCESVEAVHRLLDDLGERVATDGLSKVDPVLRAVLQVHAQQTGFSLSLPVHLRLEGKVALLDMQLAVRASLLYALAERVFGERPAILVDHCSARRQVPTAHRSGLAWHQDVEALAIRRPDERGLPCWIPLVAIDDATPALEVWPHRVTAVLPHRRDTNNYSVLTDEPAAETAAERYWTTRGMVPGDVLDFDGRMVHRTESGPGLTRIRHSIDLRMRPLSETAGFESAILT